MYPWLIALGNENVRTRTSHRAVYMTPITLGSPERSACVVHYADTISIRRFGVYNNKKTKLLASSYDEQYTQCIREFDESSVLLFQIFFSQESSVQPM